VLDKYAHSSLTQTSNFMKIRRVVVELLFHVDRQTDRQTDRHDEADSRFFGNLRTRPEMTQPATQNQGGLPPVQRQCCWVQLPATHAAANSNFLTTDTSKPTADTPQDNGTDTPRLVPRRLPSFEASSTHHSVPNSDRGSKHRSRTPAAGHALRVASVRAAADGVTQ